MRATDANESVRRVARAFEQALPAAQRKQLGQFFTGLPLGRLLAHLALEPATGTVLDPMAGHGDLLDAAWEAASERGIPLKRLDGIEIERSTAATCSNRLADITSQSPSPDIRIIPGDAFEPSSTEQLPQPFYDLVITNPPYVRYQARTSNGLEDDPIRRGLKAIVERQSLSSESEVWRLLAEGYSGFSDLSIPAWILAASMVRSGGRLALVVPATWRTRNYADLIRYLLLRCFALECVVEDKPPGWFPDALVRTHLIVARRLSPEEIAEPLHRRTAWPTTTSLNIGPNAAGGDSLVGAAFTGSSPEAEFAAWRVSGAGDLRTGISVRTFSTHDEWKALATQAGRRSWYQRLENDERDLPLFASVRQDPRVTIPEPVRELLPVEFPPPALLSLRDVGIEVGQGLRTGCNDFFYVTVCGEEVDGMAVVEAASLFARRRLSVPVGTLRPVLRRQSEITSIENGSIPAGRVLDLRSWVLPEDLASAALPKADPSVPDGSFPRIMPEELAVFVREAATTRLQSGKGKLIPELAAVRTNARPPRNGDHSPRFWYMLPDFASRHLPDAFVARINHGLPWIEANAEPPILIDANFATFWSPRHGWTRHALKAFLNSLWCRASMEALGTAFGGGALKLEATHLTRMAVPYVSAAARTELDTCGRQLHKGTSGVLARIDEIILGAVLPGAPDKVLATLAARLSERAQNLSRARRRDKA